MDTVFFEIVFHSLCISIQKWEEGEMGKGDQMYEGEWKLNFWHALVYTKVKI